MIPDPQNTESVCMFTTGHLRLLQSKLKPFTYWPAPLPMVVQIGVTRWHKHLHIDSAMWFKGLDHTYVAL